MRSIFRIAGIITYMFAVLCFQGVPSICAQAQETASANTNQADSANFLTDPNWENGMEGWEILANNQKESFGDHDVLCSIVYQDIPVEEEMHGKTAVLSGRIGLAPEEPTQEYISLTLMMGDSDGYVVDAVDENGDFIYSDYIAEETNEFVYHKITMDIPEEAVFMRVSLEIRKQTSGNYFHFSDLSLELKEKETAEDSSFIRVPASNSENTDTDAFVRSTDEEEQIPGNSAGTTQEEEQIPDASEVYTFTGSDGTEYSVFEANFAADVISYMPGSPWTSYEVNQDPQRALGLPDYDTSAESGDYCLGDSGILVLGFGKINQFTDGPGPDLYVFETGAAEDAKAEVSGDLINWYELGIVSSSNGALDMNGKVPEGFRGKYVRLTDVSHTSGGWPGADIDTACFFYADGQTPSSAEAADPDQETLRLKALVEEGKGCYYGTGAEGYNRAKAEQCFREAAEEGCGEGWYYLGNLSMNSIDARRYEWAMDYYKIAVEAGFPLGYVGQGILYDNGYGTETDDAKARELYELAIKAGFVEGYCPLGTLYINGEGVLQDTAAAMDYYKLALESEDFMWKNYARCRIGDLYLKGTQEIAQDYTQAMSWFRQAADEGYGMGELYIGNMYYYGDGVEKDKAEAFKWYKKAAEHGNITGMYDTAFLLENGIGADQDDTQAAHYYQMAASIGDLSSMYALGVIFEEGRGVSRDLSQARFWLEQALELAGDDDQQLKESIGEELAYIASEQQ